MSNKLGYSKELIYQNIDKSNKKVIKSYLPNNTKKADDKDRYYNAEIQIITQMLYSIEAVQYYMKNLAYLHDNDNKRIATYICNCYQNNNKICKDEIIKEMEDKEEMDLVLKMNSLLADKELPKTFDKNIFDVIVYQKPLQNEIDELEKLNEQAEVY